MSSPTNRASDGARGGVGAAGAASCGACSTKDRQLDDAKDDLRRVRTDLAQTKDRGDQGTRKLEEELKRHVDDARFCPDALVVAPNAIDGKTAVVRGRCCKLQAPGLHLVCPGRSRRGANRSMPTSGGSASIAKDCRRQQPKTPP